VNHLSVGLEAQEIHQQLLHHKEMVAELQIIIHQVELILVVEEEVQVQMEHLQQLQLALVLAVQVQQLLSVEFQQFILVVEAVVAMRLAPITH
jgi:hypothetical protein